MRIAVIGRSGQLARALDAAPLPASDWKLQNFGRPDLDIADADGVNTVLGAWQPDLVINAAAYTAVDRAESEPDAAYAINLDGVQHLSDTAKRLDMPLIHVSTDYVFDGTGTQPYRETDPVAPLGVYGQSKFAGEEALRETHAKHIILRTAWVHSPWGANFVKTMLRLGAERTDLNVVGDQTGTPTYAPDLADAILKIAGRLRDVNTGDARWGTYHLTNSGQTTWFDLPVEIFAAASRAGHKTPNLTRIPTRDYPTPAKRPAYSVLDSSKLESAFEIRLRDWDDAARDCVEHLRANQ